MTNFSKSFKTNSIKYKKKSLVVIPFLFTFANAIFGLLSVIKALDCEFVAAAYCILLAAFMDGLDGKLARAFGSCSVLGMELDSLCDAISFCLAPAILVYSWEGKDFGVFGIIVLAIYLCAGLFRLAKFNIISAQGSNKWFLGLPTPVGAILLSLIILHEDWVQISLVKFLLKKNVFIGILLLISFLMISKVKFPSFKQHKGIIFYIQFCLFVVMLYLALSQSPYMIFVPIIYIVGSFSHYFYSKARHYLTSKF